MYSSQFDQRRIHRRCAQLSSRPLSLEPWTCPHWLPATGWVSTLPTFYCFYGQLFVTIYSFYCIVAQKILKFTRNFLTFYLTRGTAFTVTQVGGFIAMKYHNHRAWIFLRSEFQFILEKWFEVIFQTSTSKLYSKPPLDASQVTARSAKEFNFLFDIWLHSSSVEKIIF